jgi:hypothetical protein
MATAVNAGIAATAAVPEAVATAGPYVTSAARSVGAAGGALLDKGKKGYEAAKTAVLGNPEKTAKLGQAAGEFLSGAIDQSPPPQTLAGGAGYAVGKTVERWQETVGKRSR